MGTSQSKQPRRASFIAEQDEIFSEQTDGRRTTAGREFARERDRLPIATKNGAARCAGPGFGYQFVVGR